MTIDAVVGSAPQFLLSGTWSFSFARTEFSGQGAVEGSVAGAGNQVGLFLSRSNVPCPQEVTAVASRVVAATLVREGDHLTGPYVVAGCPGGRLELTRE